MLTVWASPKTPAQLTQHDCINLGFSRQGGAYAWELKKGKNRVQIRVAGAWAFNSLYPAVDAALAGFGLAYTPEELALPHIAAGRFQPMLKDGYLIFPGLHIFYANRGQSSPVLSLIIEALCYPR